MNFNSSARWLSMLAAIFLVVMAVQPVSGQSVRIQPATQTVKAIFQQIEQQTNVSFVYSSRFAAVDRTITLAEPSGSLPDILEQITEGTNLTFARSGQQIIVKEKNGGTVNGTVTTRDGQPAGFVTVSIRGQHSVQADEQGHFTLGNIEAGTYTVTASYVGLRTQQQPVTVTAGGTVTVTFTLSEDAQTLQEVVVNGERVNKFADKETEYVARMPLGNLENPQVYSTVTKELMTEQINTNINQALNNIPGSVAGNDPAGGVGISARGFSVGINARNGMASPTGRSTLDPVNIERIEVLKGPSGTLFGSNIASYGGVVNLVTKKPYDRFGGEISYSTGSWELNRVTIDVNSPLNADKTALFRINAAYNREGSFMDAGHHNTIAIAPSLYYELTKKLSFLVDIEYYKEDKTRNPYPNINTLINQYGLTNVKDVPIGYTTSLYGEDFSGLANTFRAFVVATYKMSDTWTSTTSFSNSNTRATNSYQAYPNWLDETTIARGLTLFGPIADEYINLQQNFNGQFAIGKVANRIVLGLDYLHHDNKFNYAGGLLDSIDLTQGFSPVSRSQADWAILRENGLWSSTSGEDRYSAYVSNVTNFTKQLLLMLSLRLDRYQQKEGYGQTALAPKLGLVYQVVPDQVSLFGNYMSNFNNYGPFNQPDGTQLIAEPEYAKQWEAGIKMNTFDKKLNASISYYNIDIENAIRVDENNFIHQDGDQHSKGIDIELIANPLPGLNLLAGYTFNDNQYIESASNVSRQVTGNPQNIANFWVSYKFLSSPTLKNVGIAFGGNYVDKSYFNGENTVIIPSYFLLNASVFYDQPKWRVGLKANNLTDQKYWSGAVPQPLRSVVGNVTFRF